MPTTKKASIEQFLPPLWVIFCAALYAVWWLITELRELCILLIIVYAIAYILDPLLTRLEKRKISRSIGFFSVCTVFILIALLFFVVALPPLVTEAEFFLTNINQYTDAIVGHLGDAVNYINSFLPEPQKISLHREELLHYASIVDGETIKKTFFTLSSFLLEGYSVTVTVINLALLPVIVYYLSIDIGSFHAWCLSLIPKSLKKRSISMFFEINHYLRAFVVGQTLVSSIMTVCYCTGFAIAGHSQWLLIGVVAGVGNLVPYLGTALGIILGVTFSVTADPVSTMLLKTAIVFIVVQLLEGMVISPKIVGEKVGLSPLLIILAILSGGKLFGILGIFLAVPTAAVIRVLGSHLHHAFLEKAGEV